MIVAIVLALLLQVAFFLWTHKRQRELFLRAFAFESRLSSQDEILIDLARDLCVAEALLRLPDCPPDLKTYSQHGEELYLWSLLGYKPSGVFIEVGAYDGCSLSNTFSFERIGWKGALIEAHPQLVKACRYNRPNIPVIHAAAAAFDGGTVTFSMVSGLKGLDTLSFVSTTERQTQRIQANGGIISAVDVPRRSLESIINEHEIGIVDFLSIDVEGIELEVLKGINYSQNRPRLLIVEDNSSGTDLTIESFLRQWRYKKARTVGCNDIYLEDKAYAN